MGKLFLIFPTNGGLPAQQRMSQKGYNLSAHSSPVGGYKKNIETTANSLQRLPDSDIKTDPKIGSSNKSFLQKKIIDPTKKFIATTKKSLTESWQTVKQKLGLKKQKKQTSENKTSNPLFSDDRSSSTNISTSKETLNVVREAQKTVVEQPNSSIGNITTNTEISADPKTNVINKPGIKPKTWKNEELRKQIREGLVKTSNGAPEIASLKEQISEGKLDPKVLKAKQQLVNELEEKITTTKRQQEEKLKIAENAADEKLYEKLSGEYLEDGKLKQELISVIERTYMNEQAKLSKNKMALQKIDTDHNNLESDLEVITYQLSDIQKQYIEFIKIAEKKDRYSLEDLKTVKKFKDSLEGLSSVF